MNGVEDIYELSPMQAAMLFDGMAADDAARYRLLSAFRLRGDLDHGRFAEAWRQVVQRHAVLRASVLFQGLDKPLLVVHEDLTVPLHFADLSDRGPTQAEAQVRALFEEERARPFDLEAPPLMRLALYRTAVLEHWFIWSIPHLLAEGWSLAVVLGDVLETYRALGAGRPAQLPPVRPFRDFIAWIQQRDPGEAESFWRGQLAGFTAPTPLPGARGAPELRQVGQHHRLVSLRLPRAATMALAAMAQKNKLTLNTLMRAAWAQVLARYSGEDDIVFGTMVSGRSLPLDGVESMVGLCVNMVPVRIRLPRQQALRTWLQDIQSQQAGMSLHEYCGLSQIRRWSDVPGSLPLFESLLVFENWAGDVRNWRGVAEVTDFIGGQVGQGHPLTLVVEPGEELTLGLVHDEERIAPDMAQRVVAYLQAILEALPGLEGATVGALPLLTDAERGELLGPWSRGDDDGLADTPVCRRIEARAAATPDAVAIIHDTETVTYADLDRRASQLAHHLLQQGAAAGRIVGVCLDRRIDLVVALLAVHKAGAAYLPLDPAYPSARLAFMLGNAGAQIVICNADSAVVLPPAGFTLVRVDGDAQHIAGCPGTSPPVRIRGEDLAYVVYTSGSTGEPKGVMIEQRALSAFISAACRTYEIRTADRVLQFATISFDAAAEEIFATLCGGATLVLRTEAMLYSVDEFLRRCGQWQLTVLDLPTAYWHELAATMTERALALPASVRLVIIGGEAAQPRHVAWWLNHCGEHARLVNTYGPTETTVVATLCDLAQVGRDWNPSDPVPIGRPLGTVRCYVLDSERQPVPVGAPGELYLGGTVLARGYAGRPELTAERFLPAPFAGGERLYRTGDLAHWGSDGHLVYRGRRDHQVKLRGFRIELGEVEAALRAVPAVVEAVVVLRDDPAGPAQLVAYVVIREGGPDGDGLRATLAGTLPEFMLPRSFVFLPAIPRTPAGKLDRRALPAPAGSEPSAGGASPPRNDVERRLCSIWREVLGREDIGIHDNFFDLGGHSLLLLKVHARIAQDFGTDLSYRDLFEQMTIARLGERLGGASSGPSAAAALPGALPSCEPLEPGRRFPLSHAQERLWLLNQFSADASAYNIQLVMALSHDAEIVSGALQDLVVRHPMLRTFYRLGEAGPEQVLGPLPCPSLAVVDVQATRERDYRDRLTDLALTEMKRPFALGDPPVWRALLVRDRALARAHLVITLHHIACDGWSLNLLRDDLDEFCRARAEGRAPRLEPLSGDYFGYVQLERGSLTPERTAELIEYWRGALAGAPPTLDLPADRPRPPVYSYRGAACVTSLAGKVPETLREVARRGDATLFMTLLAAFKVLLARYSGQDDIVVGTPLATRQHPGSGRVVGVFLNTLALRTSLAGNPGFSDLLQRVRATTLDAFDHQALPFDKVVDAVQPPRDASRNPIFQAMFTALVPHGDAPAALDDGIIESLDTGGAQVDLAMYIEEHPDRLDIGLAYGSDLFEADTARQILRHYRVLLESIAARPDCPVEQLDLLDDGDRTLLLHEFNRTAIAQADTSLVHQAIAARARRQPDVVAVEFEGYALTYADLWSRAGALAAQLRSLGIGPGALVGIFMERSADMLVALLGVLEAGGAYLPLDPEYPPARIAFMIADAGVPVILTQQALQSRLVAPAALVMCIDEPVHGSALPRDGLPPPGVRRDPDPDDVAYVIYTSGSTGQPKGVEVTHRGLANFLRAMAREPGMGGRDVLVAVTTLSFDIAALELYLPLICGARVVIAGRRTAADGAALAALIAASGATHLQATPATWRLLLESGWPGSQKLAALCGGEALPPDLAQQLLARCGGLWNLYGPTEATVWATRCRLEPGAPVTIGRPIDNTTVYIVDRHRQPVPPGVAGELLIGGVQVARGYLGRPDLTAERFIHDPFAGTAGARLYRTGDLARFRRDGCIEFIGRGDGQVKLRGFRIETGEIEAVLCRLEAVRTAVVALREDTPGDQRLVAYVVPAAGQSPAADVLRRHVGDALPAYMVPAVFVFVEALPLTPNGKVDRRALPAPPRTVPAGAAGEMPGSDHERAMARIWAELLGIGRVHPGDTFFDLGGHSLLAVRAVQRFEQETGVRVAPTELINQTLRQICVRLPAGQPVAPAAEPVPRRGLLGSWFGSRSGT